MGLLDLPQQAYSGLLATTTNPFLPTGMLANAIGPFLQSGGQQQPSQGSVMDRLYQKTYPNPSDMSPEAYSQSPSIGSSLQQLSSLLAPYLVGGAPAGSLSAGIRAYHGSPYDFNAFDASKIGTGEGAQAYGHGLYFAESEPVAQSYKTALGSSGAMDALDSFLTANRGINLRPDEIAARLKGTRAEPLASDPQSITALQKLLPQYLPNMPVSGADLTHYRYLDSAAERLIPGKMYEVNINAEPSSMLNWDKPLSQQSPQVQQALKSLADVYPTTQDKLAPRLLPGQDATGNHMYQALAQHLSSDPTIGAKAAAQELQGAGIPGIRYLDQGSRGAGQGTSNYVAFDPSIISILRKYGIAGPLVGGGALASQNQ